MDTGRKLVNVLGIDQADSDGGDLNDRSESTDPIEEFLRDIQAECGEDDDDDERKEAELQRPEEVHTPVVPLTNMPSRITEVSGDLLDDTADYGYF